MKVKRILIVGSLQITHIRRCLKLLCDNKGEKLIIDVFDPCIDEGQGNICGADNVYRLESSQFQKRFFAIRKLGTYFFLKKIQSTLEDIISKNHYDLINIHYLPMDAHRYVSLAHKYNIKIALTPLGSDVLRLPRVYRPFLQKAFDMADYVTARLSTGFCDKLRMMFSVSPDKFIDVWYGSETLSVMQKMKGQYTRTELAAMNQLPPSSCYICCGYTASVSQRHSAMIDAIAANIRVLPKDYCLIFPLSYGPAKEKLYKDLSEQCCRLGLKSIFLTEYMTFEQVSALRFVTDYFIHIQPTDAFSATLQECLVAGSNVINGKWLDYPSLEKYGYPYFICDSLENLPQVLCDVFSGKAKKYILNPAIEKEIWNHAWEKGIKSWIDFFENC